MEKKTLDILSHRIIKSKKDDNSLKELINIMKIENSHNASKCRFINEKI